MDSRWRRISVHPTGVASGALTLLGDGNIEYSDISGVDLGGALGAVAPSKPQLRLKVLSCNKPEFNRHYCT